MKKFLMTAFLFIGLSTAVDAAKLTANSPFGPISIEVNDGVPPREVFMPGATPMSGSFPVHYDDGRIQTTFPLYFDGGTTMQDIIDFLVAWFF